MLDGPISKVMLKMLAGLISKAMLSLECFVHILGYQGPMGFLPKWQPLTQKTEVTCYPALKFSPGPLL